MSSRPTLWILLVGFMTLVTAGVPPVQAKPHPEGDRHHHGEQDFEDMSPDVRIPPGISERVFTHVPRSHQPAHLGTCIATKDDTVDDYGTTGWHLPRGGIKWKLNTATIPAANGLTPAATQTTLAQAFQTWADADTDKLKLFLYDGATSINRPRFDRTNVVLWGKISAGAIAITYVRYNSVTGEVVDIDTVFNSRFPWAIFDAANGECQTQPDAYDLQNIATHEFGHWVGLDDRYNSSDRDLTMYGYGAGGELKKRDLGQGDKSGVNAVAP
jgi:hypothetical protein